MEIQITEEKENPLFKRKEIKGISKSEKIPSRIETMRFLSDKFSTNPENIKIKKISGGFGTRISNIEANIYSSKKDKDKIELTKKKDKIIEKEFSKKPEETLNEAEQKSVSE